jgi:hypothetical protein
MTLTGMKKHVSVLEVAALRREVREHGPDGPRWIEARVTAPYEELCVTTFRDLCARVLRDEALEAGVDPFLSPVTPADRLALLTTDPELTYPNGDRCQYISMTFRCSYLEGEAQVVDLVPKRQPNTSKYKAAGPTPRVRCPIVFIEPPGEAAWWKESPRYRTYRRRGLDKRYMYCT